jgi:hypothetical protein
LAGTVSILDEPGDVGGADFSVDPDIKLRDLLILLQDLTNIAPKNCCLLQQRMQNIMG